MWQLDRDSRKMRAKPINSGKTILVLCIISFIAGSLFTSRTWNHSSTSQTKDHQNIPVVSHYMKKLQEVKRDCDHKRVSLIISPLPFLCIFFNIGYEILRNWLKENLGISSEKLGRPIKQSSKLIQLVPSF